MKTVTIVKVVEFKVECPFCLEINGDWHYDPRGETTECEECHERFLIDKKAEFEAY